MIVSAEGAFTEAECALARTLCLDATKGGAFRGTKRKGKGRKAAELDLEELENILKKRAKTEQNGIGEEEEEEEEEEAFRILNTMQALDSDLNPNPN